MRITLTKDDGTTEEFEDVIAYDLWQKSDFKELIEAYIDTSELTEKGLEDFIQQVIYEVTEFSGYPDVGTIRSIAWNIFKDNFFERQTLSLTDSVSLSKEDIDNLAENARINLLDEKITKRQIAQDILKTIESKFEDNIPDYTTVSQLQNILIKKGFRHCNGNQIKKYQTDEMVTLYSDTFVYQANFDGIVKLELKYGKEANALVNFLSEEPKAISNLVDYVLDKRRENNHEATEETLHRTP